MLGSSREVDKELVYMHLCTLARITVMKLRLTESFTRSRCTTFITTKGPSMKKNQNQIHVEYVIKLDVQKQCQVYNDMTSLLSQVNLVYGFQVPC